MSDEIHKEGYTTEIGGGAWGVKMNGEVPYPFEGSATPIQLRSTFDGTKLPQWRHLIRNHKNATTVAGGIVNSQSGHFGSGQVWYWTAEADVGNTSAETYRGFFIEKVGVAIDEGTEVVPKPPQPSWQTADNQAIDRLYGQIHSAESSVLAGEDLGEIHQTVRLLRSPMRDLRKLTTDLMQGQLRALGQNSVRKIVRGLSATTLEYKFGIKPLTSTIASALVGLQNRDHLAYYIPLYASGTDTTSNSGQFSKNYGPGLFVYCNLLHERERKVEYSGEYRVRTSTDQKSVQDVLRLRFRDTVPTLWNLLPWSWLIDYCTNVGTIAEQFSIDWNGIAWMRRTERQMAYRHYTLDSVVTPSPSFGLVEILSPGTVTWQRQVFSRAPQDGQPRPKLEIDFKLNPGRLLNVAAALGTRIPIVGKAVQKAVRKHPGLPQEFSREIRRRGTRIPYPFH